jgi:hypothetical protein
MADERACQNHSENPDPQEKPVSGDDITPSQEQLRPPDGGALTRQAPTEPDRMAGAHQPPLPGAKPGKDERHQLNFTLPAPGLEVCRETI